MKVACKSTQKKAQLPSENRRINSIYPGIKRSKYQKCDFCGKMFSNIGNLNVHIKDIHQGSQDNQKNNQCDFCKEDFLKPSLLKNHIKKFHQGNKIFKCEQCTRVFTKDESLKAHVRTIHDGSKKYKCDFCDQIFNQTGQVTMHYKTAHDGKGLVFKTNKWVQINPVKPIVEITQIETQEMSQNKNPKTKNMSKSSIKDQKILNEDEIDFCDKIFSQSGQLKNPNSKDTPPSNKNSINNAQNTKDKSKNAVDKTKNYIEKSKNSLINTQSPNDKPKNSVKNPPQNPEDTSTTTTINPAKKAKKFIEKSKNSSTSNNQKKSNNKSKKPVDISKIPVNIPANNENPMKKNEKLKCDFCDKKFTKAMHLSAHITYKHKKENRDQTSPEIMLDCNNTQGPPKSVADFLAHGTKNPHPIDSTQQIPVYDAHYSQYYQSVGAADGYYNQSTTTFENWRQIQQWQAYYHHQNFMQPTTNDSVIYLNASQSSVSPLPIMSYQNY